MAHEIRRRIRRAALAAAVTCAVVAGLAGVAASRPEEPRPVAPGGLTVPGLDGTDVRPLVPADDGEATVLLFVMTDCPISNRYAPEIRRLHEQFAGAARFWLVYVDAQRPVDELREHRASFGYPFRALRDVDGALVALAGATVTPEAAVFDAAQRLVYRGRDRRSVRLVRRGAQGAQNP